MVIKRVKKYEKMMTHHKGKRHTKTQSSTLNIHKIRVSQIGETDL